VEDGPEAGREGGAVSSRVRAPWISPMHLARDGREEEEEDDMPLRLGVGSGGGEGWMGGGRDRGSG